MLEKLHNCIAKDFLKKLTKYQKSITSSKNISFSVHKTLFRSKDFLFCPNKKEKGASHC